jgi:cobalt-zinc-cadmium efflux system outer membrane protein
MSARNWCYGLRLARRSLGGGGCLLGALVLSASSAAAQTPVTMDEAVRVALERHPAIREAAARVDEARGLAQQAGASRNPMVGALADDLGTGNGSAAGKYGAFVEVPIALGGRLGANRAAGDAMVSAREAAVDVARRRVIADARQRWIMVAIAARKLEVQESLARLAAEGVDIAGKLFNVGLIDRADVLDAEAAAAEATAHRHEASAALDAAWEQLANIMGAPDLARTRAPMLMDVPALSRDAARARLMAESPFLEGARREAARQRALVTAAQKGIWPDLELKAEGWFDREREATGAAKGWGFGAEAGLRLPLFDRRSGQVLASHAGVRVAEASLERTETQLADAFARAWANYSGAVARAKSLQDEVLPRAEEAYRLYLENFQQMASPYPQVLMARERIIRTREAIADALEQAWLNWVTLDGLHLEL